MIKKFIRKRHYLRLRAELKGARYLRDKGDPFFVHNLLSELADIPLNLKPTDFPKALVGNHAEIGDILLRQRFLIGALELSGAILRALGNKVPLKHPLPDEWVRHLSQKRVPVSHTTSQIYLFFFAIKNILFGFANFGLLLLQKGMPTFSGRPYIVFPGLQTKNLPNLESRPNYDIISWYQNSVLKKDHIKEIWAQSKPPKFYSPPENLIVSPSLFPRFSSISHYVRFVLLVSHGILISIYGFLQGKWWYGYIFRESISLFYIIAIGKKSLADEYYFNNSGWFLKPLWTYEAEKKGATVSLYYYSTNMENIKYGSYVMEEIYGLKAMKWKNYIVWDQQQEDYLRPMCPDANFTKVGYVDMSGRAYSVSSISRKKILTVFDVTPVRQTLYTKLGYAITPFYTEEYNLSFFHDIIDVFSVEEWEILWKRKRVVDKNFCSKGFLWKQHELVSACGITIIDPDIAARSLIEASNAVISMPFTSTAILGKIQNKPSVYYYAIGQIQQTGSHGLEILGSKDDLALWRKQIESQLEV